MFSEMVVSLEYKNKLWNNFKKNVVLGGYIHRTHKCPMETIYTAQCTVHTVHNFNTFNIVYFHSTLLVL